MRLDRLVETSLERLRLRGGRSVARMVRLTAAAVASYAVAGLVFPRSEPLLAPLTALLVVQLTPVSILASGVQRVVSVVVGVVVAVGFASMVHITWWSLGTVIALSLLIGQLLRLGPNLLEVPISAMLVLGVGSRTAETAAWKRVAETLVGAGVGVASNLLFPPRVATEDAASAIRILADDLSRLLDSAAADVLDKELSTSEIGERATRWLGESRRLTHDIPNVGTALLRAEESRRLNLRALGTVDSGPGLRLGLEALEHSALALRSMFRAVVEAVHGLEAHDREVASDIRSAMGLLLESLSRALGSYGSLVYGEAQPGAEPPEPNDHQDALASLQDAHGRVIDLLLVDPRDDSALALLTASLLATVERLLQELSVDERIRRREIRPPTLSQRLAVQPALQQAISAKRAWRSRRRRGDNR